MVLKANALFSLTTGILLVLFHQPIAAWFSLKIPLILAGIGIGLLAFAYDVWSQSRLPKINENKVKMIIAADFIWVLASIIIILFQLFSFSSGAYVVIAIIAIAVADFGLLQGIFLRKWLNTN